MKIVVGIDGEHYTDLYYGFVETEDEAYEWAKEDAENLECFEFEREEHNRFAGYYWYDPSYDSIPDFTIYECYDLNEKPYILVWWHAYNGVDFTVRQFDTFEEANEVMKTESNYAWIEENDPDYREVTQDDGDTCVDTGCEWEMWQIIKREA